ncbi:region, transmembrane domain- and RING domain-containing protein 1 [Seminavis robusta]|uniref:Region, transmembrane domain- and RING domain-containing protein 1 n=1 Tax=Seminavis robusta TaxID=568900 RepID=A0A9N8EZG8_9STRA|nr:region, transmembrane domain- and RING domain-containing protein 1 [Seminavis robusta]|eukprot:Sro3117_g344110.1 region, transmembrane domain- and RING domain-containing protein 1 (622) ;mRNA; f:3292-5157
MEVVVAGGLDDPFPGRVAGFGNHRPSTLFLDNVNLIIPPPSASHLCRFPEEAWATNPWLAEEEALVNGTLPALQNNITTTNVTLLEEEIEIEPQVMARDNMNVALFVSYGGCQPSQKARVAAALRQNFTRYGTVTHLLIYNNNRNAESMDDLHTLMTFVDDKEFRDIGIIFVSTRSGVDIMEAIETEETRQRIASPFFFADGNELWYFPVSFREIQFDKYSGSGGPLGGGSSGSGFNSDGDPYSGNNFDPQQYPPAQRNVHNPDTDDFYWFRLIVFSILVVSPCFRAAYLWYAGGARIRFRYNEDGRVVGLQYIPPMPYWFSPRPEEPYVPTATRMTPEEVLALPEVVYEGSPCSDDEEEEEEDDQPVIVPTNTEPKTEISDAPDHNNSTTDLSESTTKTPTAALSEIDNMTSSETVSHAATTDEEQGRSTFSGGMQSTCSICIDDFEQGEKLRMLPRCRHMFHTECILPWLTERQGCCPLCKVEVIEQEPREQQTLVQTTHDHDPTETFQNEEGIGQPQRPNSFLPNNTTTQSSASGTISNNTTASGAQGNPRGTDEEAQFVDVDIDIETFSNELPQRQSTSPRTASEASRTNTVSVVPLEPERPPPEETCDFENEPDEC